MTTGPARYPNHMGFNLSTGGEKPPDAEGGKDKWQAKTGRINGQQTDPFAETVARRRQRQNRCQYRPDARRPAKGKASPIIKAATAARTIGAPSYCLASVPRAPEAECTSSATCNREDNRPAGQISQFGLIGQQ